MKIAFLASKSPSAQEALASLTARYGNHPVDHDASVIVALGGDGFMLEVLHETAECPLPVYGMNRGTVGFLMNGYDEEGLQVRIAKAIQQTIYPLTLHSTDRKGRVHIDHAINEVSILRQGPQAANLRILVNGREKMDNLMCDGALLSTPAGSTAYNYSAYGPILPIGANILALTPIAAFRPRRWRGAVLPDTATVTFENVDPDKRPVMVSADGRMAKDIVSVEACINRAHFHKVMFDPGHTLEDRILKEQFL
jgi:NAD+ kinase